MIDLVEPGVGQRARDLAHPIGGQLKPSTGHLDGSVTLPPTGRARRNRPSRRARRRRQGLDRRRADSSARPWMRRSRPARSGPTPVAVHGVVRPTTDRSSHAGVVHPPFHCRRNPAPDVGRVSCVGEGVQHEVPDSQLDVEPDQRLESRKAEWTPPSKTSRSGGRARARQGVAQNWVPPSSPRSTAWSIRVRSCITIDPAPRFR